MSGPAPMIVRAYRAGANLVAPLAYRRIAAKLEAAGVAPGRQKERLGRASAERPEGRLLWCHAASVGESLSILRMIEQLGEGDPNLSFLITSGTATSAQIVASRLPPRTVHQFAPLDAGRYVRRFLGHWRPDAAIFVESELWPQMLAETRAAGVPLALVNARLSPGSARNWKRFAGTARHLLDHFTLVHCQNDDTAAHLAQIGVTQVITGPNLKSLAGPLPFDAGALDDFRAQLGARPLWLACSTHPGEDEVMAGAHKALLEDMPEALLLLVPRHPDRAAEIGKMLKSRGFNVARRSAGEPLEPGTQVYLADTLGETGLWFQAAPLTCLCGSFTPVGGHNPYEPAYAGSAILHGPLYANFTQTYAALHAAGAAEEVADGAALAVRLHTLLSDAQALEARRAAARGFAGAQEDALSGFAQTLSKALALR